MMEITNKFDEYFKPISTKDAPLIKKYLSLVDYNEANHNIVCMYIWLDYYPLYEFHTENYMLLLSVHEGEFFVFMPLCKEEFIEEALLKAYELFAVDHINFNLSCYLEDMKDKALSIFKNYHVCPYRGAFDYIYEIDQFRTFKGKKLQKKRNHLNAFYKLYPNFIYEPLNKNNIEDVRLFLNDWKKENNDPFIINEKKGINRILDMYDELDYLGGVIRIDKEVKAFLICSVLCSNTIQEHVEKADDNYRGLYQAIIHEFFKRNYLNYEYLNREDDMGLENLRKAKMAYNPCKLVNKYWLCEGKND